MRKSVRYSGRVQGVGFRATTAATARRFPITGWVRNEPDGSVQMEVQGDAEAIGEFMLALGATFSRHISGVDESEIVEIASEEGFDIRR